jgi:hypothetical protein
MSELLPTPRDAPLPTFLIIGAQKSATRWLRHNLGVHPQIFTAKRELEFFDNHFDDGADAYRQMFSGWSGQSIVGEATPGYMIWRKGCDTIAARIDQTLPTVRLLAILRNPVDRAYSSFMHHMTRKRIEPDADFIETVMATPPEEDHLSLISGGWYGASLEPYVRRFGDRLHVLVQDRPDVGMASLYATASAHLGADPSFVPPDLETVLFSTTPQLPKGRLDHRGRRRPLTARERAILYPYFADDIEMLEKLLDTDLRHWKLGARRGRGRGGADARRFFLRSGSRAPR